MTVTAAAATADSCLGDDQVWPPGFRFHPTDEELVLYYLKRKICRRKIQLDIIRETDVYKWDPEELPAQSILKTGDRQWFFFSPRDRKYPNGARSNRATRLGYWKATGKDRAVTCNSRTVGVKKTLVFYRGRAPSGERTDWVMHEYTLDEEELKRCQNVKDYYALYKVYKKSGPGPKNGEQYGAPFKEEEWADDEYVSKPVEMVTPVKPSNDAIPADNVRAICQVQPPLNDVEEFMRQIADEPALPQPQAHLGYMWPQVVGEEETQSTLLDPSPRDVLFPEPIRVFNDQSSFGNFQSPSSQLQPNEAPEVTSVANGFEQVPRICEEDFLEMDDLLGPEPLASDAEKLAENVQFNELDGLSEFDLFHDAAMFLQDMGSIDQGSVPFSYAETMINQASYQLQSESIISSVDQQLQPQSNINLMDQQLQLQSNIDLIDQRWQPQLNAFEYGQQLQPQLNGIGDHQQLQPHLNGIGDHQQLQPHLNAYGDNNTSNDVFTPSGSNLGNASPTSGLIYNDNQDQGDKNGGGTSRFSSALWSFVESIPTTPASASENPLVNRAFERMSSFSRLTLNARNINVAAINNNGSATARRTGGKRGFFFISILGALCAILCFFIGTVRVLGRSIS